MTYIQRMQLRLLFHLDPEMFKTEGRGFRRFALCLCR